MGLRIGGIIHNRSVNTHQLCLSIHPPKYELFDLRARTNTDPKGIVRAVEVYLVKPWGLYMARPAPGREQFHYLESWLLPSLGLRVTIFHTNPGHERNEDYYLDIGEYCAGPTVWQSHDYYLDLVLRTGIEVHLDDVDELFEAVRAGLLSVAQAELAVSRAVNAIEGLAQHSYHLDRWLASQNITLSWGHQWLS